MKNTIDDVTRLLIRELGEENRYTLQQICNAFEAVSPIDRVIYLSYDVPQSNPIWGQFWRYSQQPNLYRGLEATVEIRYAAHLDRNWRRFVVCKELCHALDTDQGVHSATDRSIDRILNRFAWLSSARDFESFPAFDAETFAEIGALELLCPVHVRRRLISSGRPNEELADEFGIPQGFAEIAFDPHFVSMVEEWEY